MQQIQQQMQQNQEQNQEQNQQQMQQYQQQIQQQIQQQMQQMQQQLMQAINNIPGAAASVSVQVARARGTNRHRRSDTVLVCLPNNEGDFPADNLWPADFDRVALRTMTNARINALLTFYGLNTQGV
jgi:type II secretory pathway pseudopilin PulG